MKLWAIVRFELGCQSRYISTWFYAMVLLLITLQVSAEVEKDALVSYGFRREIKPIRLAGLAVAGLAVVKVIFFDLSSLDALYRVGSVFVLGLVTLSLAYLYYRHDRSEGTS